MFLRQQIVYQSRFSAVNNSKIAAVHSAPLAFYFFLDFEKPGEKLSGFPFIIKLYPAFGLLMMPVYRPLISP